MSDRDRCWLRREPLPLQSQFPEHAAIFRVKSPFHVDVTRFQIEEKGLFRSVRFDQHLVCDRLSGKGDGEK